MSSIKSKHREKGVIFIATLFIILILLSLTLVYTRQAQVFASSTAIQHAQNQADANIRAATQSIFAALTESITSDSAKIPTAEQLPAQAIATEHGLYWIIKTSFQNPESPTLEYGLEAENAKLNLNTMTAEFLKRCTEIDESHIDAILDWKDRDSDTREIGAESEYYQSLDNPYTAKNSNYETVDELMLVKDITPAILYGEDTNQNGTLDPNEDDGDDTLPLDNADGTLNPGYAKLFTIYSKENAQANNNSNSGNSGNNSNSSGNSNNQNNTTAPKIGLINILYASPIVLETIGLTKEEIDAIIIARGEIDNDTITLDEFIKATEIKFKNNNVTEKLTTNTHQFTADILAISKNGKAFKRVKLIIDALPEGSSDTISPKVIYYKDITHLGWPLDHAIPTQLKNGETAEDIQDVHGTESY